MRVWLLHAAGLPWLRDFRVHAVLYVAESSDLIHGHIERVMLHNYMYMNHCITNVQAYMYKDK